MENEQDINTEEAISLVVQAARAHYPAVLEGSVDTDEPLSADRLDAAIERVNTIDSDSITIERLEALKEELPAQSDRYADVSQTLHYLRERTDG